MNAMEFQNDSSYDSNRCSSLDGTANELYPGQAVPIFHAGQSNFKFRSMHERPNDDDYLAAVKYLPELMHPDFPEIPTFAMPAHDSQDRHVAEAQRDSLMHHAFMFKEQKEPFRFPQSWLEIVAKRWPNTTGQFKDWLACYDELYDRVVDAVTKTSSSGCSCQLGQTKGAALRAGGSGPTTKIIVFQRLLLLLSTPIEELENMTALELVQRGFVDPIRVFLKCEPHKFSKRYEKDGTPLVRKRWRIISSCSLVDELVDRILYTLQNKAEIKSWWKTPSMPGVGFSDDASADHFFYRVLEPQKNKKLHLLDFQAWDWGFKQDMLNTDADIRSLCCGGLDRGMFRKRALTIGFSVFVLDDGSFYEQCIPGIMKSGWLDTSSTNSRGRDNVTILHAAQTAELRGEDPEPVLEEFFVVAMGDDSVEEEHVDGFQCFKDQLDRWGLRPDPGFDGALVDIYNVHFCSHNFDVTSAGQVRANLRNHLKSVAKFLYLPRSKRTPEQIAGIRQAFRWAPELSAVERMWEFMFPELWAQSWFAEPALVC